jgi:biopolymer transport protein ExbD
MALDLEGAPGRGKKPVDAAINMVPFIDLLVSCIAFLIITAVWTQLERLNVRAEDGPTPTTTEPSTPPPTVLLRVGEAGFALQDDAGVRVAVPKAGGRHDLVALGRELARLRQIEPADARVLVAPDDGQRYEELVATMDTVLGARFEDVALTAER